MFEYLMPLLVMPDYPDTLITQTNRSAVRRQIEYGGQRGVPWGMSESGYNMVDVHLNYQYRAFGVPGLGLQRGLADDLVIAPYASALALMIEPEAACENLQRLAAEGMLGPYGMHEAVDYTPSRVARGQARTIVRSYMAHHQGMSLLAFADVLLDHAVQKRFAAGPRFQATLMLLHERIPRSAAFLAHPAALPPTARGGGDSRAAGPRHHQPRHACPRRTAAVERPIPRAGHRVRRRLQPLEGHRRDPLARGPDP
jgi:cyclic beta-1,2-glucan synthetase